MKPGDKYRNRHSRFDPVDINENLTGAEQIKLFQQLKKIEQEKNFWQILPFAVLLAFAIVAIAILASQGCHVTPC